MRGLLGGIVYSSCYLELPPGSCAALYLFMFITNTACKLFFTICNIKSQDLWQRNSWAIWVHGWKRQCLEDRMDGKYRQSTDADWNNWDLIALSTGWEIRNTHILILLLPLTHWAAIHFPFVPKSPQYNSIIYPLIWDTQSYPFKKKFKYIFVVYMVNVKSIFFSCIYSLGEKWSL